MNIIHTIFGQGEDLHFLQMSARAVAMFFISLILIRIGGMRLVGKRSVFDTIIVITMGSVLAKGVVGESPFLATVAAATSMIIINKLLARACCASQSLDDLLKGKSLILYRDDQILWDNMKSASLSKDDLIESLRLETQQEDLGRIERAHLETNGRISFIIKTGKV